MTAAWQGAASASAAGGAVRRPHKSAAPRAPLVPALARPCSVTFPGISLIGRTPRRPPSEPSDRLSSSHRSEPQNRRPARLSHRNADAARACPLSGSCWFDPASGPRPGSGMGTRRRPRSAAPAAASACRSGALGAARRRPPAEAGAGGAGAAAGDGRHRDRDGAAGAAARDPGCAGAGPRRCAAPRNAESGMACTHAASRQAAWHACMHACCWRARRPAVPGFAAAGTQFQRSVENATPPCVHAAASLAAELRRGGRRRPLGVPCSQAGSAQICSCWHPPSPAHHTPCAQAVASLGAEFVAAGAVDPPQTVLRKLFEKLGVTFIKLGAHSICVALTLATSARASPLPCAAAALNLPAY